eukprot:1388526-Rhodomonas_salina.1
MAPAQARRRQERVAVASFVPYPGIAFTSFSTTISTTVCIRVLQIPVTVRARSSSTRTVRTNRSKLVRLDRTQAQSRSHRDSVTGDWHGAAHPGLTRTAQCQWHSSCRQWPGTW